MEPSWLDQWQGLCDKLEKSGYSALSEDEKTWLNARALIDSTNNGGLISYFYNSYADDLPDCLRGLDALGVSDVRALVERVCNLFGQTVPLDIEARNDIINSWPDGDPRIDAVLSEVDHALYEHFDDLEAKLETFIRRTGLAT